MAKTRRRNILDIRTRLPRERRSKAWHPAVPDGATQNSVCEDLLRRQEHSHLPRPAAAHEQAVLPFPDPVMPEQDQSTGMYHARRY